VIDYPAGTHTITETIVLGGEVKEIRGAGKSATTLVFSPAEAATLFDIRQAEQIKISGIKIVLPGSLALTGISVRDVSILDVSDLAISAINNTHADTTAIRIYSRELIKLDGVSIWANNPLVFAYDEDTDHHFIDHTNFRNCLLVSQSDRPIVNVQDGVELSNVTFDGYQAWVGGSNAISMIQPTRGGLYRCVFRDVRWEKHNAGSLPDGACFDIQPFDRNSWQLKMENCYATLDEGITGYLIRNIDIITLDTCGVRSKVLGSTPYDIDASCDHVQISNFYLSDFDTVPLIGDLEVVNEYGSTAQLSKPKAYRYLTRTGA